MKQTQQAFGYHQDNKFSQQLTHLQSVVGLANWNMSRPTMEDLNALDQRGRQLQSSAIRQAIRHGVKTTVQGLNSVLSHAISGLIQHRKQRRDARILLGLNAHTLKDIGISRADAVAVATGKIRAEEVNAQRFARAVAPINVVQTKARQKRLATLRPSQHLGPKSTKLFAANDPRYVNKCA